MILRESLRIGTFLGLFLGLLFGLEIGAMGDLLPYPRDSIVFILYFSLLFVIISIVGGILLGFIYYVIKKLSGGYFVRAKARRFFLSTVILTVLISQGTLFWIEINRPIYLNSIKMIAGFIAIFILSDIHECNLVKRVYFIQQLTSQILKQYLAVRHPYVTLLFH